MVNEFCDESTKYMEEVELGYRKKLGQYFTPRMIREALINLLPKNIKQPKVLDPACGTGEFLLTARDYFKKPILEGWEIDKKLTKIAKKLIPEAKILNHDSLKYKTKEKFDFIIGNPPYFEFQPDKEIKNLYAEVIGGRVNIFSMFIKLGIDYLKEGGYLAFVIPPSMNNGAYFANLRKYIIKNTNVENIKVLEADLFYKAQQLTMIMVMKKTKNKGKYIFKINGVEIFSENWKYLKEAFENKKSLRELGFKVRTGRVVWNQNKEKLTDDKKKSLLIWSHNITDEGLVLNNKKCKLQYINLENPDEGLAIIVNRVTGAGKAAKIRAVLIPKGQKFFAENHCNVIYPPLGKEKYLSKLLEQLKSAEMLKIWQSITGNTQVSKNELEKLCPVRY